MIHTRKVLLLNASFEPLGIVTVARAVRLVWKRRHCRAIADRRQESEEEVPA